MEKVICIYHSRDLDGFTSGAIVKRKFPEAILIGYDYGQPTPWDQIPENTPIIMIDVSLPMKEMHELAIRSGSRLTWIDHHISAIKEYKKYKDAHNQGIDFLLAVLEDGRAACEIAWRYLFPDSKMPEAVELLGEYDTWRKKDGIHWDSRVLPFQFGMRMHCSSPETFPHHLMEDLTYPSRLVSDVVGDGCAILQYQAQFNAMQCKRNAFEREWEGYKVICLNGGGFNSDVFKTVYDPAKHDVMMPFQFNGKFWVVSLYTTHENIDCSVIAKKMGGGGHRKAAGFQVNNINFIIPNS